MPKFAWTTLLNCPKVLGVVLLIATPALAVEEVISEEVTSPETALNESAFPIAQVEVEESDLLEQLNDYGQEGQTQNNSESQDQVTSVTELTDIDPFWFEAVEKMVDKYGCIVGYPDETFRGQRNITRYEFAAAVSRCMEYWEERLVGDDDIEGLAVLRRIVNDLREEIALLQGRVDDLDGRVSFLEDHQFSTTAKLAGEVIFGLSDAFGGLGDDSETVLQDRVRLNFLSSFTGKDRLQVRLQAGNLSGSNHILPTISESRFT
ncbi:MAG: iron uptake porin, partial [Halobacteriota archaeon]|nr:iron uptake porin [Halobacteriota archaeon]